MRVALVTGSSRGLGRHIAHRLARDGFALAVNGRDGERTAAVADAIRAEGGVAGAFPADVTDEEQVGALVEAVAATLGPVDVLVLNATGPQPEAPVGEVTWDDHLDQLAFFVRSPVLVLRAVLPSMRERGFGRIVHVDSEVADRPPPGRSAYAAAKSAQIGLARAWAAELAPLGITVNSVAAGLHPGRAARGRAGGVARCLCRERSRRPVRDARRARGRRRVLRLRRRRVRHRPAARRRRRTRSRPRGLTG